MADISNRGDRSWEALVHSFRDLKEIALYGDQFFSASLCRLTMYQDKTFQDPSSCCSTITVPSVVDVEHDRVTVSEVVDRPIEDYFFIKIGRGILFLMLAFFIVLPMFWLTLLSEDFIWLTYKNQK